jgi:hypothetical protein
MREGRSSFCLQKDSTGVLAMEGSVLAGVADTQMHTELHACTVVMSAWVRGLRPQSCKVLPWRN